MQSKKKEKISLKHIIIIIITALFLVLIITFLFNQEFKQNVFINLGLKSQHLDSDNLNVNFIDVGQGDCSLIQYKDKNILVDTGDEVYSSKVVKYLNKNGVNSLDYIIISHPHLDHIGGLINIISNIKTNKIIMREIPHEVLVKEYNIDNLLLFAEENHIEIHYPSFGEQIVLDKLSLKFLFLDKYDNINDSSLVTEFAYYDKQITFTGDIEETAEKYLSNFIAKTDILKVAHHGSKTSSNPEMLSKLKPKISIISCGADNNFGHPSDNIVSRLSNFSDYIFRTDLYGDIKLIIKKDTIEVLTEKSGKYTIDL